MRFCVYYYVACLTDGSVLCEDSAIVYAASEMSAKAQLVRSMDKYYDNGVVCVTKVERHPWLVED